MKIVYRFYYFEQLYATAFYNTYIYKKLVSVIKIQLLKYHRVLDTIENRLSANIIIEGFML